MTNHVSTIRLNTHEILKFSWRKFHLFILVYLIAPKKQPANNRLSNHMIEEFYHNSTINLLFDAVIMT